MTASEFADLVSRFELQAQENPERYRLEVIGLAILGYAYLGLVTLFVLVLLGLSVLSVIWLKLLAIKIIIPIAVLVGVIAKAMWVRIDPPAGFRVTRKSSPELFNLIEQLRSQLDSLPIHEVVINADFNAGVLQVPRLGVLGWQRNVLLLGLPLMKALTREQLKAVLAHEFGHLAGGHAKVQGWLYRLRMSWERLLSALELRESSAAFLFNPFFKWYSPYFSAKSFPLARKNEYEADMIAAKLTDAQTVGAALLRAEQAGTMLSANYWPSIQSRIADEPTPRAMPYTEMSRFFCSTPPADADAWLESALARPTSFADTHPSLVDRLKALGISPSSPAIQAGDSDLLLGEALEHITSEFDSNWQASVSPAWRAQHEAAAQARQDLEHFQRRLAAGEKLNLDESISHALLTEHPGNDPDGCVALLETLASDNPGYAILQFHLGSRRLQRGDERGAANLQACLGADPQLSAMACDGLIRHYESRNEASTALAWRDRLQTYLEEIHQIELERSRLRPDDEYVPHGLDASKLAELMAQLESFPEIEHVYLVQKYIKGSATRPLYVLGFEIKKPFWKRIKSEEVQSLQARLVETIKFPGETFVFNVQGDNQHFRKLLRNIRDAQLQ